MVPPSFFAVIITSNRTIVFHWSVSSISSIDLKLDLFLHTSCLWWVFRLTLSHHDQYLQRCHIGEHECKGQERAFVYVLLMSLIGSVKVWFSLSSCFCNCSGALCLTNNTFADLYSYTSFFYVFQSALPWTGLYLDRLSNVRQPKVLVIGLDWQIGA